MDSPTSVETLNDSLNCSAIISKFIAPYGAIKYKLALGYNNA